jgi:hypothetical protein
LAFVAGQDVHQIGMGPVGHLGPYPNELVTVLDQGPEVGEHLQPVGRRQDLTAGHDPGDRHRVDHVRPALGGSPAPLSVRQRGRHLSDVLSRLKQKPRQSRSVAERALDPDHAVRTTFSSPSNQSPMSPRVVGELGRPQYPAQRIHRCHGERALRRIDPDRHLHAGLLLSADLRWWLAEDK